MFPWLGRSKNRAAILRILFGKPGEQLHIRELARLAGTSAGNTQKELRKLEDEGILASTKKGNLRLFSVNQTNPLFRELESMVAKTIGIEMELKKGLVSLKGLNFAFIFGSYAKSEFKAGSDLDLFVIGNINEDELIQKLHKVEKTIGREINFHIAKKDEFLQNLLEKSFYQDIVKKYTLLTNNPDEFIRFIERAGKPGKGQKTTSGK